MEIPKQSEVMTHVFFISNLSSKYFAYVVLFCIIVYNVYILCIFIAYILGGTPRTAKTPTFWGYPQRIMITHTIDQFILDPV